MAALSLKDPPPRRACPGKCGLSQPGNTLLTELGALPQGPLCLEMQLSPNIMLLPFWNRVFVTCFTPGHNARQGVLSARSNKSCKMQKMPLSPPGEGFREEFFRWLLWLLSCGAYWSELQGSSCLLVSMLLDFLLTLSALEVNSDPMLCFLYSGPHRFVLFEQDSCLWSVPQGPSHPLNDGSVPSSKAQSPLSSPPLCTTSSLRSSSGSLILSSTVSRL